MEIFTTQFILLGISILFNIVLLIGVFNLLRQNEQLEDRIVNTINSTRDKVEFALKNMQELDNKEMFEKDDDVGVTFQEIKKVVENLNNEL